jgi:FAS-associated factor 2
LTSSELQEFCHQHQILVWGSNVRNSEAFQVSNTLQATTYPFMAIIALQPVSSTSSSTKMAVIERMEGPISAAAIIQRFEAVMTRAGATLNRYRAEREQRELERRLREEQENAYRESLRNDQEKERQRKEKLEQEKRAEEARILEKKNKELYLDWVCQKFMVEPTPTENEKLSRISFKLVNGDRVIRKFKYSDGLEVRKEFGHGKGC